MGKSSRAKIFKDIENLISELHPIGSDPRHLTIASGGFDCLHLGHLDYIQDASNLMPELNPLLLVVVNGEDWVKRKKGYEFMPEIERANIVAGISGVDYVLIWDDGTPTVSGVIEKLIPDFFAKGGDRDSEANVPEYALCKSIDCKVIFNVGGSKIQSSSNLIRKVRSS